MRLLGFVVFLSACLLPFLEKCWDVADVEDMLVKPAEVDISIPLGLQRLLKAYPDFLDSADGNTLVWKDGTTMPYDDGVEGKDFQTLLDSPDLQDQFQMVYPAGRRYCIPERNCDPGRIRCEPFFLKMYGASPEEVRKNLVPVSWLPGTVNRMLMITSVNGVSEKLQAVSDELDALARLHGYLDEPAGTYNWRRVAGTNRLSPHSFGIAVDINVKCANYWRWDDPREERFYLGYANRMPLEVVEVFEKYGFIWGGKWYHYDTMHFEYRPEMLPGDRPTQRTRRPGVAAMPRTPPSVEHPSYQHFYSVDFHPK